MTKIVAANIKTLMKEQGLNANSLAKKACVNHVGIYDLMNGKIRNPRLDTLEKMAKALGVSAAELISDIDSDPRENLLGSIETQSNSEGLKRDWAEIGQRVAWLRGLENKTQAEYAKVLGFKRERYSMWERGAQRLSLDGAILIREQTGASLDWLYFGVDDTLPMTLRNAWRDHLAEQNKPVRDWM